MTSVQKLPVHILHS